MNGVNVSADRKWVIALGEPGWVCQWLCGAVCGAVSECQPDQIKRLPGCLVCPPRPVIEQTTSELDIHQGTVHDLHL